MSVHNKIKVAVIGATGYTGLDLIFLLSKHPRVEITKLCATRNLGKKINFFDKRIKKKLPPISTLRDINWKILDLVFLSLPNGEAQKIIRDNFKINHKLKFIDLSADFRIANPNIYKQNYNLSHKAKYLLNKAIYSLPEFSKDLLNKYRIIANPGCYPTSVQIPLIPLIKKDHIKINNIIIDSKSGYSGAGKNLEKKFSHKNLYASIHAYGIQNHRHVCEIDQELKKITKKNIGFTFNPYLLPTFRGILSSIYVETKNGRSAFFIRNFLKNFIKILDLLKY